MYSTIHLIIVFGMKEKAWRMVVLIELAPFLKSEDLRVQLSLSEKVEFETCSDIHKPHKWTLGAKSKQSRSKHEVPGESLPMNFRQFVETQNAKLYTASTSPRSRIISVLNGQIVWSKDNRIISLRRGK